MIIILSRLEIVLPLLKVLLKRRRSEKWISTVPSIGPREKKIFFNTFFRRDSPAMRSYYYTYLSIRYIYLIFACDTNIL